MPDETQRHCVIGEAGLHRDGDKARLVDYLDWSLIREAGEIATQNNAPRDGYPEGKYPDLEGGIPNYKAGIRVTKYLDSIMRHLIAIIECEDTDDDSGRSHWGHLLCNLSMAHWTVKNRPDLDDRMAVPEPAKRQDPTVLYQGRDCPDFDTWPPGATICVQIIDGHGWSKNKLGDIYYARAARYNEDERLDETYHGQFAYHVVGAVLDSSVSEDCGYLLRADSVRILGWKSNADDS